MPSSRYAWAKASWESASHRKEKNMSEISLKSQFLNSNETERKWRLFRLVNLMYFHYSFRRNLNNLSNYSDFPRNQSLQPQKLRSQHYCMSIIDSFVSVFIVNWHKKKNSWLSVPPMARKCQMKSLPEKSQLHSIVTWFHVRMSLSQTYHFQLLRHWRVESESSGCVTSYVSFPSEWQSNTSGHMLCEALLFV